MSQNVTGWRRLIGWLKLQVIFRNRDTHYFGKEPLTIGLFCGKWPVKIRHPMGLCHPVPASYDFAKDVYQRDVTCQGKEPLIIGLFWGKEPLIIGLFCRKWPVKTRHPMGFCKWCASARCDLSRKRATHYRALLREMTYEDKASHGFLRRMLIREMLLVKETTCW